MLALRANSQAALSNAPAALFLPIYTLSRVACLRQVACDTPGSSAGGGGKGRRAHRKEKRASADARARMLALP